MKRYIISFVLLFFTFLNTFCSESNILPNDTIEHKSKRISVLTCSPGEEIYALFGHTAIRYKNEEDNTDIVFNYGLFSFNSPNFIWRFIKGETDYILGITYYNYFEKEYSERNSYVYEQVLNLSENQTEKLLSLLFENSKPENRTYRYNFFYENCTTKAKEKIEEATDNDITYNIKMLKLSFRDIIHQFTKGHEWSELGIDLCIGSEADKPITANEMMFSPFYYKDFLSTATFSDTGKPLAMKATKIVFPSGKNQEKKYPSPLLCFGLLFFATIVVTFIEYKTKKTIWMFDAFLFGSTGICGIVIAFLVFFSTHPAVSPNYMLIFMHPIHLILLPFFINKEIKNRKSLYHAINSIIIIAFFVLMPIIPQHFNIAILFLALSLLVRSSYYTYKTRISNKK